MSGGLSLTRKAGESIWIEDVEVIVQRICGNKVQIKIKADECVRIYRAEVKAKRESEPRKEPVNA